MTQLDEVRSLADALPVIVFVTDTAGSNTFTNRQFQSFCGKTAEALLGDGWLEVLHPEDGPRAGQAWRGAVQSGEAYEQEFRFRDRDGEYHWHLCRGVPVRDAEGRIDHWVGTCTNVHDRKREQRALRESASREDRQRRFLDTLLDNADVAIAVLEGYDLRFTLANRACQQLRPDVPMPGLTVREVFPDAMEAGVEAILRRVMRTGEPEADVGYPVPVPGRGDATWDLRVAPLPAAPGEPPAVLVMAWEATERARTQAALVESEERWKLALAATGAGAWELDLLDHTAWRSLRHDQIFGYHELQPSWTYEQFLEHVLAEDRPAVDASFQAAQAARRDWQFECRIRRVDGAVRWIRAMSQTSYDARGEPRVMRGVVEDITERKAAEEALRQSDQAKDAFLAVLGHELRNPLAPLRTALDLLEQTPGDADLLQSLLPMMDRQLSHLVRLVDDLLDSSRITRGTLELQPASLDLAAPLSAAIEQVRSLVEERQHELSIAEPLPSLRVHGDFERLTQVFANLLSNSAKYTDPGGAIAISCGVEHDQAVVRVRDSGFGIPPQRIDNLFEPFSQIPEHRDGTGAGLGIGLALSRQLVELHGGSIEAHSEGLGRGSEFVVRLPVEPAGGTRPQAQSAPVECPPRRVLVVDDNVDAADGLKMLLTLQGHAVVVAYDGAQALEIATEFHPEAVLLDLGLPGMDGLEVARRLRALPDGDRLLLVAVTGWGQEDDKARTREAGFDAHLTKPLDTTQLTTVLARTS